MRLLLIAALVASCATARAQEHPSLPRGCAPIEIIADGLAKYSGEKPAHLGALPDGESELAVFTNSTTGTFTIVIVREDGIGCGVATGEHWRTLKPDAQ